MIVKKNDTNKTNNNNNSAIDSNITILIYLNTPVGHSMLFSPETRQ